MCPWTGTALLAHPAGMPLMSLIAPCWSWGAHRDPLVVSRGCFCFPAPLGASARAGAQPDFLQHPPPPSLGLQSSPGPPGDVQLSRLSLGSCSHSCSDSIWVCMGDLGEHCWVLWLPRALWSISASLRVSHYFSHNFLLFQYKPVPFP